KNSIDQHYDGEQINASRLFCLHLVAGQRHCTYLTSIPENYIHSNPSYVHGKKIWNLRIFEREKIREPVLLIDDRQQIDHKDPHSTCMLFLRLCMPVGIDHGAKKNRVDRITHSLEISTVPLRKSRRRPTPFGISMCT